MMTGIPPPRVHEYEWQISRMNDKGYSRPIRELVGEMLHPNRAKRPDAFALVDRIEDNWRTVSDTTSLKEKLLVDCI